MNDKAPRKRSWIGLAGILLGSVCLTILCLIDVFGPSSYSSSGSGTLNADGSITMVITHSSVLPRVARASFYLMLLSLPAAIASVIRKEEQRVSWLALLFGLVPFMLMFVPTVLTATLVFGITLTVTAAALVGRSGR